MKTSTILLCGILLQCSAFSQHVPICQGANHFQSKTVCWAYAQGKAFGSSWNDPVCPLATLYTSDRINSNYFEAIGSNLKGVQVGDILEFQNGGHYAYVSNVGSMRDYSDIYVDQVEGEGTGPEHCGIVLWKVRDGYSPDMVQSRGPVTQIHRMKLAWPIQVKNDFTGGTVGVDASEPPSPYNDHVTWKATKLASVTMDGQVVGGYLRKFREWTRANLSYRSESTTEIVADGYNLTQPLTYTAVFDPYYLVTFRNSLLGTFGGRISLRDNEVDSPCEASVIVANPNVVAQAMDQTVSSIEYTFSRWTNNKNSQVQYDRRNTFQIQEVGTVYTAIFDARPCAPSYVTAGGSVGSSVCISWTDNPNSNVTLYRVYRMLKNEPWTQVGYAYRGAQQWVDYSYTITGTGSDQFLEYGVTSIYAPTGAESDRACAITYATFELQKKGGKEGVVIASQSNPLPKEYAVSNYPNPFNPSTTISYQLPEDASVQLEVFDMMGKRIALLVSDNKSAGYHSVVWSGKNESGTGVASGMYLYRFTAEPVSGQKAFSRSGKLLMMK